MLKEKRRMSKPKLEDYLYYEESNPSLKIYHGDCFEIMPLLPKVDLVVTDPPYGIEYHSNYYLDKNPHEKIHGDNEYPKRLFEYNPSVALFAFMRWDNLKECPKPKSFITWIKNNWSAGDLEHEYGRMTEGIAFYPGTNHKFKKRLPDVIDGRRTPPTESLHPTQKPVWVVASLIQNHEGNVLDPFLGSGTTLVACKELNRNGIGIEINEKYCEIAKTRLKNTTRSLF